MKRTDIAMLILIASASITISYFVVSSIPIFRESGKARDVPQAQKIEAGVAEIDPSVFNKDAINPTVKVIIGEAGSE